MATLHILRRARRYLHRQPPAAKTGVRRLACLRFLQPWVERLEGRIAPATVTWNNPAGGDWDTVSDWTDNLGVHRLPGASDDVVIPSLSAGASVTHTQSTTDTVNSVTASAPLTLSGGTLSVATTFSDTSTVTLSGGTLAGATVPAGTMLEGYGGLSGVTLDGTLDENVFGESVTITDGLTLGSGLVETTGIASLIFSGTQTLGGSGEVLFGPGGNVNTELALQGSGSVLTIAPGITIDGFNARLIAGSGAVENFGTISVGSSVMVPTPASAYSDGTFTLDGAWTDEPGARMQAVNDGSLVFNSMGANDGGNTIPSGIFTNDAGATVSATGNSDDGGGVALEGNGWSNAGTISMTNSSVSLGGTFVLASLGTLGTNFTRSGGTVSITGTLNNTGTTLALNDTTGSWDLNGATVNGGTITTTGSAMLGVVGSAGILNGPITLSGTLDDTAFDSLTVNTLLDLSSAVSPAVVEVNQAEVNLAGTQTLGDTGEVRFGPGTTLNGGILAATGTGAVLTIGPTITIDGDAGTVDAGSGAIINQGTINDDTSGGTLTLSGAWTDDGTGTIEATSGGTLVQSGTWTNDGTMAATSGSTLMAEGTWTNSGTIQSSGAILELEGTWTNAGTITTTTSTVTFAGTWSNQGTYTTNADTAVCLEGTFTGLGTFTNVDTVSSNVYITGTLNNTGETLALNDTTGPIYINQGIIQGGTITTSDMGVLNGGGHAATLNGVTLAGTLSLTSPFYPAATVEVTGGMTLSGGTIDISNSSVLNFDGTESLTGTGTITIHGGTESAGILVPQSGSTLTIGAGVTIQGDSGVVNNAGGGVFTSQGTIAADNGGTLLVIGFTNVSGGTLTGGTWEALGGSKLRLVGANITTSAAGIVLDGAAAAIDNALSGTTSALAGLVNNTAAGSFTVQNGATFTSSAAFTNAGTLTSSSGATFAVGGTGVYTQTGGTTILNGGTLGTAGNQIAIEGGTLSGPGTVIGSLTNAGEVDLGSSPGTLTVNGSYTQTSNGILTIKVGGVTAGSQFDQVNVSGTATLGGTLTVTLTGGYAPTVEETYAVMTFASATGNFATGNLPQINGNPAFATNTTATSFELLGATTAPNLAVSNISFTPANASQNQTVTVTFTVTNLGTVATTAGSWTDSVYLSTESVVDANAVLLGRVMHTGDLASQADYTATLTAPVPGLPVGSYHVLVVVDSGLQVPDTNRANGTGVAPTELSTQPPSLQVGTPVSGTISSGEDLYYVLNVTPGASVVVGATFATAHEAEFSALLGALPTNSDMGLSNSNASDLKPQLPLPTGPGGDYYIGLEGLDGAGTGQAFTLLASLEAFSVSSFSESSASNTGPVTMDVTGSGFTPQTAVSLQNGSTVIAAQTTTFVSANDLSVTFDLTNQPAGTYTVEAANGSQSALAPGTFQITANASSGLQFFETAEPSVIGPSQDEFLMAGVVNNGTTNAQVPPFFVSSTGLANSNGAEITANGQNVLLAPTVTPLNFFYPGGTLAPGKQIVAENVGVPLPGSTGGDIALTTASADSPLVLTQETPFGVPTAAWDAIVANLVTNEGGSTAADLANAYQADALYLAQVGDPVNDQGTLFNFELLKAGDMLPEASLNTVVDSQTPEPGLSLTFERSFSPSLVGRYTVGLLGYGWTSNWDISAATDPSTGIVYIQEGAATRTFDPLSNGTYVGQYGDQGTLTLAQGRYTLHDPWY